MEHNLDKVKVYPIHHFWVTQRRINVFANEQIFVTDILKIGNSKYVVNKLFQENDQDDVKAYSEVTPYMLESGEHKFITEKTKYYSCTIEPFKD